MLKILVYIRQIYYRYVSGSTKRQGTFYRDASGRGSVVCVVCLTSAAALSHLMKHKMMVVRNNKNKMNLMRFILLSTPWRWLLLILPLFIDWSDSDCQSRLCCQAFTVPNIHQQAHRPSFAVRQLPNRGLVSSKTAVYSATVGNEDEIRENYKKLALDRGQRFIDSIMNPKIEGIANSDGMRVVRNVVKLERGIPRDIILRNITEPFWQACIDVANMR